MRVTRLFAALALCFVPMAGQAQGVQRVVSLNLCTDQLLVLLAPEKVAGLTFLARDPALSFVAAKAATLPAVRASAESVMARHPDLVIGARFAARTTLGLLERTGLRVARIDLPTDFPGIGDTIRATAILLDVPERAEPLIAGMDAALPSPGPTVEALVWEPRGWTAGPGGLMDAVLRAAGMINVGPGGRVGLEAMLRHPPSLLIVPDDTAGPSLATEMLRDEAIRGIPVRTLPAKLTICAGPFTAEAVARLAR